MISPEKVLCLVGSGSKVLNMQKKITQHVFQKNYKRVVLDVDEMLQENILGMIAQRGLFDDQVRLFEFVTTEYSKDIHTFVKGAFALAQEGDAVVVRIRSGLTKPRQTMIQKTGWKLTVDVPPKKEAPKPFAFTEACIAKNKKQAWLGLCDLIDKGQAPQALLGALVWQFKTLYMVKLERHHGEQFTSVKSFTRSKIARHAAKWSISTAGTQYQKLLFLQSDFGFAAEKLEKWVLESV